MNHDTDDDMQGFDDIEALLRESADDDSTLFEPPADLWASIEASITTSAPGDVDEPVAASDDTATTGASVTRLADRRRPIAWLGAVAAASVLVAAGALALTSIRSSSDPEILATAQLTWDEASFDPIGADATAVAELVGDDGSFTIDVDRAQLPEPAVDGEALELWLIQPDADNNPAALVSLGTFDEASAATFVVPEGFDPDEYFIVDISVEPADGNPAHSGRSILRGPLVSA